MPPPFCETICGNTEGPNHRPRGPLELDAPIKDFPEFERLEFKGHNLKYLDPFLKAMKSLAVKSSQPAELVG